MTTVPAYRTDHVAAFDEVDALASLLADVIQATAGGAFYVAQLESVAESARQHESVQRELELRR